MIFVTVAAAAFGVYAFVVSRSAIHEIEGLIVFLIVTVAIGCISIIDAIKSAKNY